MPNQSSQITFERNSKGQKCLVYREDRVTKTHDGGLGDMRHDHKIVWVLPSVNTQRCPVRLVEKYLSLCPLYFTKSNFYMQSRQKPTLKCWYASQVVGQNTISKVVKKLMEAAEIQGFFTNHSLRFSGGTRLFNAGIDWKLVKEITGHVSDAVDAYQITSEEQQRNISAILQTKPSTSKVGSAYEDNESKKCGKVDKIQSKCSKKC